ncbi:unnamed protein product [Paramecium primaurelia]|uniref:Uncharacterized protein n=1 Tax=Paramecium primaurelia TaxID=5886 RepID=A0A8S1PQQ2_PARPR|nr:unnamed protein product [Paramecium primaurelia]
MLQIIPQLSLLIIIMIGGNINDMKKGYTEETPYLRNEKSIRFFYEQIKQYCKQWCQPLLQILQI